MAERAIRFGTSAPLAGVLAEPDTGGRADRPAVVLLNSGILHHAGASRLHVQIARRLSAEGFTVLRFDFSGIGDSEVRRDTLPFKESAVVEAREAMDYLQQTKGADRFLLMGLCSGADMGYHVTRADERVVGLVQLDAWAFKTPMWYVRRYVPRLLRLRSWSRKICRLFANVRPAPLADLEGSAERAASYVAPEYRRRLPPKDTVVDGLKTFVGRDIRLQYIFSGGQESYNYAKQFRHAFRNVNFRDLLNVEYIADADHTFTGLPHQIFVVETVATWATVNFASTRECRPDHKTLEADLSSPASPAGVL